MKIKKKKIWTVLYSIAFILLLCDKLYNLSYSSGAYTVEITLCFTFLSLLLVFFHKCRITKDDYGTFAFIAFMVLYGLSRESIRYGMVFFSVYIWSKLDEFKMDAINKILTVLAVAFSIYDISTGHARISGFCGGSPTLFSIAAAVLLTYFLLKKDFCRKDIIWAAINLIMIWLTESASTQLFALALIAYKVIVHLVKRFGMKSWLVRGGITISVLFVTGYVFLNYENLLAMFTRDNRIASTSTRIGIYEVFFRQFIGNARCFLIGYGGGYTQEYIRAYWGAISHLPVHQDILMFACEYGVIGLAFMYFCYLKKLNMSFIIWGILILASFHNIILAPMVFCLIILNSSYLNKQYAGRKEVWG